MNISFHWIHDRILQEHFHVFWKPGATNLGDYHSKHHPTPHHIKVRHNNLHEPHSSQTTLQGCVNSPNRYTTGTSIDLSNCVNANLQQRENNQFSNAVTAVLAAVANPLDALASRFSHVLQTSRLTHNLINDVFIINIIINSPSFSQGSMVLLNSDR